MVVYECFLVPTQYGTKRQFTADGAAIGSEEVPVGVYEQLKCKVRSKLRKEKRSARASASASAASQTPSRLLTVSVTDQTAADCKNVRGKKEPLTGFHETGCHLSKRDFLEFYQFLTGDVVLESRLESEPVDRIYADYGSSTLGSVCANLMNATNNPCLQGWEFVKKLGQGAFGAVFLVRRGREKAAVKFMVQSQRFFTSIENEVAMQRLFASHNLGPKIICHANVYTHGKQLHVILMEPIDFTLFTLACHYRMSERTVQKVGEAIEAVLMKLHKLGFTHGDMHSKNIGFVRQPDGKVKMMFIDFGQSSTRTNDPVVDSEQLLSEMKEIQRASPRIIRHVESVLNDVVHRLKPSYGRLRGTRAAFKAAHRNYDRFIGMDTTVPIDVSTVSSSSLDEALRQALEPSLKELIDLTALSPTVSGFYENIDW